MQVTTIKLENQGLKNETKWFMIITNSKGTQLTMNIGERTHKAITEMNKQEQQEEENPNQIKLPLSEQLQNAENKLQNELHD